VFFNVKVKNLAFDTSKVITNAWFEELSGRVVALQGLKTKHENPLSLIIVATGNQCMTS